MAELEELIARVQTLARGDVALRAKLGAIAELAKRLIPGCDSVSVAMVLQGRATTAAISDRIALEVDLLQYRLEEGPCLDAVEGDGRVVRVDLIDDPHHRRFAPGALDAGIATVLSLPLHAEGRVVGSVNLYSRATDAMTDVGPAAEVLVAYAAELVAEAQVLAAGIEFVDRASDAIEDHAVVNQALGLLAALHDRTIAQALADLGATAAATGQTLRQAADAVLARNAPTDS